MDYGETNLKSLRKKGERPSGGQKGFLLGIPWNGVRKLIEIVPHLVTESARDVTHALAEEEVDRFRFTTSA